HCCLSRTRCAREHDREPSAHAGSKKTGHVRIEHAALDELVERLEGHTGELPDVDDDMAVAADVAVDDVEPGAGVELRVLQSLGRRDLAVGAAGVVEDLGERAYHVVVVVEDLVVVTARATVALYNEGVTIVDHDLQHVVDW